VTTTFRSTLLGRGGHCRQLAGGNPIRPVREHGQRSLPADLRGWALIRRQLARTESADPGSDRFSTCPGLRDLARSLPLLMAGHAPSVLTIWRIHSPWLLMVSEMPLPLAPVPGKSLLGGSWSRESQYWAG
jgi:hypothetical protein